MAGIGQDRDTPTIFDKIQLWTILPLVPRSISPNNVTAFRFAMIPFVIYFLAVESYGWGIAMFVIAAFSDALDGAMARTRNQITEWGKRYDPLADKLLIGSVAAIVVSQHLGRAMAFAIIGLELIIIGMAFYRFKYQSREIRAKVPGKIKMVLQSLGIFLVLLYTVTDSSVLLDFANYTLYGALIMAVVSFVVYSI